MNKQLEVHATAGDRLCVNILSRQVFIVCILQIIIVQKIAIFFMSHVVLVSLSSFNCLVNWAQCMTVPFFFSSSIVRFFLFDFSLSPSVLNENWIAQHIHYSKLARILVLQCHVVITKLINLCISIIAQFSSNMACFE